MERNTHLPRPLVRAIVAAMRRQQRGRIEALLDNNVGDQRCKWAKRIARLRALSSDWRNAIDDDARGRNLAIELSEENDSTRTMTLLAALSESTMRRALVRICSSWTTTASFYLGVFDLSRVRNLLVIYNILCYPNDAFEMAMREALYNAPMLQTLGVMGARFRYMGDVLDDVRALQKLRKFMLGVVRLPEERLAVLRAALGNKLVE